MRIEADVTAKNNATNTTTTPFVGSGSYSGIFSGNYTLTIATGTAIANTSGGLAGTPILSLAGAGTESNYGTLTTNSGTFTGATPATSVNGLVAAGSSGSGVAVNNFSSGSVAATSTDTGSLTSTTGNVTSSATSTAAGIRDSSTTSAIAVAVTNNGKAGGSGTGTASAYTSASFTASTGRSRGYTGLATGTGSGYGIIGSTTTGAVALTNTGTATGTGTGYAGGLGAISGTFTYSSNPVSHVPYNYTSVISSFGTGSGYSNGFGYGLDATSAGGSVTITNSGTASGTGMATSNVSAANPYGAYTGDQGTTLYSANSVAKAAGYGIDGSSSGNIIIQNQGTGVATGSGVASVYGISGHANMNEPDVNNADVALSGGYGNGYGIAASEGATGSGYIKITNAGSATGTGYDTVTGSSFQTVNASSLANGYGISAAARMGKVTITNSGTASGTASSYAQTPTTDPSTLGTVNNTGSQAADNFVKATAYGYGLQGSSTSGYILIQNNGSASKALGTATASGTASDYLLSAGGTSYGYGVLANTTSGGGIGVTNAGTITGKAAATGTGTGDGYYFLYGQGNAYGYGIDAATTTGGNISINTSGAVSGYGTANSTSKGAQNTHGSATSTANGIYAAATSAGTVAITNTGSSYGKASATSYSSGTGYTVAQAVGPQGNTGEFGHGAGYYSGNDKSVATGYGIQATSVSGAITITNSGAGSATGMGLALASGIGGTGTGANIGIANGTGYGAYAASSSGGAISFTNSGSAYGKATASGTGAGGGANSSTAVAYGFYGSTTGKETITNSGTVKASAALTQGVGSAKAYGIYVTGGSATTTTTITNSGAIRSSGDGINTVGDVSNTTVNLNGGSIGNLTGGNIAAGSDALHLGSGNNVVNVNAFTAVLGLIDGGSGATTTGKKNNVLKLNLNLQVTLAQDNFFLSEVAKMATTPAGIYTLNAAYNGTLINFQWTDFNSITHNPFQIVSSLPLAGAATVQTVSFSSFSPSFSSFQIVPEPPSWLMLLTGLLAMLGIHRFRRKPATD